jgi:O-antigen ligase
VRMNRQAVEQRSAVALLYLRGLPRWLPPLALAALLVAGLVVRGWGGAVALCLVAAFLAWLAFLSWPRVAVSGRLGRVGAVAIMLALAAYQASR